MYLGVPKADSCGFIFSSLQQQHHLCYHSIILIKNPETIRLYKEDNGGWVQMRHFFDIFGPEATNLIGAETLAAITVATMGGQQVSKSSQRRGPMQLDSMLAALRDNDGDERAKPHHCLLSQRKYTSSRKITNYFKSHHQTDQSASELL